jgi:hypothetical protein
MSSIRIKDQGNNAQLEFTTDSNSKGNIIFTTEGFNIGDNLNVSGNFEVSDSMWDDLRTPASSINPPGAINDADIDTSSTFMSTLLFDAGSIEICAGQLQIPHDWKEGSELRPHIHWSPTSTHTGSVLWQFDYQIASVGGTFPGSYSTLSVLDPADGTTNKHQIAELGSIDMTGHKVSCMLMWKISRIANDDTDTYTGDARLLEFDVHYIKDSFGSMQEYIK